MRALWERFRSTVAEILSVRSTDLVLKDWIRRQSSYRFVSWTWVTCWWGQRRYLLMVQFTMHACLAVVTCKLRWWIHSKFSGRSFALLEKLKTCIPWPNKGGTDHVRVMKYLVIIQNGFAWGCTMPRKDTHLEFHNWVSQEVRTQERSWWRRWNRRNLHLW